jgi:hypothetical protein
LRYLLLTVTLLFSVYAKGQELNVLSIDSSAFPQFKIQLVYKGKKKLDPSDIKLSQGAKPLQFQINETKAPADTVVGKTIFLLVECSGRTHGRVINEIKEALNAMLPNLGPKDRVNIARFGSVEVDSNRFVRLLPEFTNNFDEIAQKIEADLVTKYDSLRRADLLDNLGLALDYLSEQPDVSSRYLFITLSAGRKSSGKTNDQIKKIISKSKKLGIPVHSITIISNDTVKTQRGMNKISKDTDGLSLFAVNSEDIKKSIAEITGRSAPVSLAEVFYEMTFEAVPDAKIQRVNIELEYNGARRVFSAGVIKEDEPLPSTGYKKYLWISIGILIFIFLIMLLMNWLPKRRSSSGARNLEQPEDDTFDVAQPLVKSDPQVQKGTGRPDSKGKKKGADAAKRAPGVVLLVSLNGRTNSHTITKDQTTIGRNEQNDVHIPNPMVTGYHALLKKESDGFLLEDLGSTQGTFVNGERVFKKKLQKGDRILLGTVEVTLKW